MIESRCGLLCNQCDYAEKIGCKGCVNMENPFWGECDVKKCCESKKHQHCGECDDFSCELLDSFSFGDGEHNDNGIRIEQCKKWRKGE